VLRSRMPNIIAAARDASIVATTGVPTDAIGDGHAGIGGAGVGTIIDPGRARAELGSVLCPLFLVSGRLGSMFA
jgi:hypothetical protein